MSANANASTDSLYLDSDVAREQRAQAETEVKANNPVHDEGQEGVLAGIKHQLDSMTAGSSLSEIGNSVGSVVQEKAGAVKEIIMDSAVPAAQGALHTVQDQISALSGGAKGAEETVSEGLFFLMSLFVMVIDEGGVLLDLTAASREEQERIDNMSDEQICDFLRDKHMSNKHLQLPK
ncbi:hypothetical protein N7457_003312 [Penicillium paradoxum]|uniref:uncharacterized protein n=1 Tax=Penicillium paradoxum TaxID=176176 RepID=UPI0025482461|nr:uncharacterized protein N7457_003312 [Penicillium paradoxum]KAJ5788322.1 hypothetical protein N7457_003312 [Penicillium paradoxum]